VSLRLLVVEDEADLRLSLGLALRVAGHEVWEAATGAEGLAYLEEAAHPAGLPDAVLLDLRLPDVDGWEVLATLDDRGLLPSLPVIVGSADADPEARRRAEATGCRAYLVKPFEPEELLAILRTVEERGRTNDGPSP
jgi:CheY-like chemotaxis protein